METVSKDESLFLLSCVPKKIASHLKKDQDNFEQMPVVLSYMD